VRTRPHSTTTLVAHRRVVNRENLSLVRGGYMLGAIPRTLLMPARSVG